MAALAIAATLPAVAQDCTSYVFEDHTKLVHQYESRGGEGLNHLSLVEEGKMIELVDEALPQRVLINRNYLDRFYERAEIVVASKGESAMVVVFRLSPGRQTFYPVHTKNYGVAPEHISKFDYVIKSFIKSDEAWEPYFCFYPQTLYGDTVDESIRAVSILSKDHYKIHYDGTWEIAGTKLKELDNRKKSFKEGGETIREVTYDPDHNLLCGLAGGQKRYSERLIWWSSQDNFGDAKSLEGHLNECANRVAELGIALLEYECFARLGPEEPIDSYQELLNGRLER